ncbi:Kinase, VPS15 [Giardia lamblia P15]|uniref:Kinase, VPS15 n=1 Tax=Giardia intestinalis (strain P15) TaxID=658858 RepID=E1EXS8_GIAIA|nr:Kinase, VPS15 [Giardia lamblia P15]
MGNRLSTLMSPGIFSKKYTIPWNVKVTSFEALNTGRFLKSYHAENPQTKQDFILKVFVKLEDIDLSVFKFMLSHYREKINRCCPHVLPYMGEYESKTHGFLIRPMLYQSLPEFILQNPWLTKGHKVLYSIQMILAVKEMHEAGLVHGDIKLSNFLVTHTHSLMLADFAPFKPYQVSMSNPVALSYYFTDTIAPERIVQTDEELDTLLLPTMEADVFSLGSALLELWTSIKPFDLPTLFEYRDAKTGNVINYVLSLLDHITHEELRGLVHAMINPIPSQRIDLSTLQIGSIFTPEELFASDIILCFLKFFNPLNLDDVVHVGATLFDGICDMYLTSSSSQKAALTKCYFCDIHQKLQLEQQQQPDDGQYASKKVSNMTRASSTINLGAQSSTNIAKLDLPQEKKHQPKKSIEMPYLCTTNMEIPFKIIEQLDATVLRSLTTCDCIHRILKEGRTSEVSWTCNVFGPFRRILASDTLQAAMYHIAYSIMRLIQLDAFSISDTYKKGILTVCSYALFMDDSYVSHLIRMAYRVFRLRPTAATLGGVAYLLNLLTTACQDIYYIPLLVMGEVFLPKNQHDRFLDGVETARHQLLDVESLDEKAFENLATIFLYTTGSSSTTYPYLINHSHVIQLFPLLLASVARLSGGDPALKVIINAILLRNKTSLLYNILRSTSITPIILSSIRLLSDNIVLISSLLPGVLPLYLDFLGRIDLRKIAHFCLGDAIASIFRGCLDQLEPSCKHLTSLKAIFQGARGAHSGKDIFSYARIFLDNYHPLRDDKAAGAIFVAILKSISILPLDLQSTCIYLFCKSIYLPSVQLSDDLGRSLWSPNNHNTWLLLSTIKTVIEQKDSQDALLFSFFLNDNLSQYINIRLAGVLMKILTLTVRSFDFSTQDSSQYTGVLIKHHVKQSINDRRHQFMHTILPKLSPIVPQIVENLHFFYPDLQKYSSLNDDVSIHHDPDYDTQHDVLRKIQESYILIERLTFLSIDDLTNPQRYLFILQEIVHASCIIIENLTIFVQQIAISTGINTDNLQEKHEENLPLYLLVKDMPVVPDVNPSFGSMYARTQDDILHSGKELSRANFSASQRMDFRSVTSLNDASIWTDTSVSRVGEEIVYAGHGSNASRHLTVSNEYQVLLKDGERARHIVELFYGPVGDAKDRMKEMLLGKDQEVAIEGAPTRYSTYSLIPEISTLPDESVLHSTLFSSLLSSYKPFLITDTNTSIQTMLHPGILSGYLCKFLNMQSVVLARRWLPFLRESSLPPSALPRLLNILLNNLLIISPGTHSLPTSSSLIQYVFKQFEIEDMLSEKPKEVGREFITIPGLQHDLKNTSVVLAYQNPLAYSRNELVRYIVAETQVALDFISMRANPRGDLIMNSKTIQGMQSNNPLYTHYSNLIRNASDLIINASITHHVNKTPYRALLPTNSVGLNDIQGALERVGTIKSKLVYDFAVSDHKSMTSSSATLPSCIQARISYDYASLKSFTYSVIGNVFILLDAKNYIHFYLNPVDEAIKFLAQRILLLSRTVKISMESSSEAHANHCSVLAGLPQLQNEPKPQKIVAPSLISNPALESLESIMEYLSTGVLTLPLATFHIPGVPVSHIFVDPYGIPILGGGKATEKKSVRHEFLALNVITDNYVIKLLIDPDMLIQQYIEAILVTNSNCNANRAGGVTFSMNDAVFSLSINGFGKGVELVDFGMLHKTQLNGTLTENTIQYLLPYLTTDQICTFLKAYHNDSVTEKSSMPKATHLYMHSTLSTSLDHANGVELLLTRLRYKNQFPLNLKSAESQFYSVMPHRILTYYNCYLLSEIVTVFSTTVVTYTALYDGISGNRMYTLPKELGRIQYACESASGSIAILTSMGWLVLLELRAGNLLDLWVLAEKQRYNVHKYPAILGFNNLLSSTHASISEAEENTETITESTTKLSAHRYYAITGTLFIVAYSTHVLIYEFDSKLEDPVLQFVGGLDVRMSGHTKSRVKQQEKPVFSAIASHEGSCILGLSNGAVLMLNECEKEVISCKVLSSPSKYRITSNIDLASTDTVTDSYKKFGVFFSNQPSGLVAHQGPIVAIKSSGHSVFSADSSGLILFYH